MSLASFSPHAATSAPSAINAASASSPDNNDRRHPSSPPSSPSSFTLPGQLLLLKQQYKSGNDAADSPYKSSSGRPLTVAPQPRRPRNVTTTRYPPHLYVLPVLLLEFLALALTRAVLPSMLLQEYGNRVYLVLGLADCVRGLLAFVACPLFGKLSDQVGRKLCLFITVIGTCAPVCSLALFQWKTPTIIVNNNNDNNNNDSWFSGSTTSSADMPDYELPPMAIPIFVVLLSLSGIFSSTFTLVFAYISDTVPAREERVSAYGLALATFGLSFTIGPMAGGYLAKTHTHYVFLTSLLLTILDILYIWFILPESRVFNDDDHDDDTRPTATVSSNASTTSIQQVLHEQFMEWHPLDAIRMVLGDPFLKHVGQVAFFYYTGLWAVISTLSLYAVQHFHLGPERLGELMSALGLCTMIAEAVLVRLLVPWWGEKHAIKVGLASFAMQCIVLGAAHQVWHLFVCVAFSLLGNLVYPSLSSLVSSTVEPCQVGQALGALNGVKALTEGIGPLVFGALMTVSEDSDYFPGWPYWIAALLVLIAYDIADRKLPNDDDDIVGYVHELEFKQRRRRRHQQQNSGAAQGDSGCLSSLATTSSTVQTTTTSIMRDDENEEYQDLLPLSEVEEEDDDDNNDNGGSSSIAANETNKDESSSWAFATPTKKKHAVVGEEEARG